MFDLILKTETLLYRWESTFWYEGCHDTDGSKAGFSFRLRKHPESSADGLAGRGPTELCQRNFTWCNRWEYHQHWWCSREKGTHHCSGTVWSLTIQTLNIQTLPENVNIQTMRFLLIRVTQNIDNKSINSRILFSFTFGMTTDLFYSYVFWMLGGPTVRQRLCTGFQSGI